MLITILISKMMINRIALLTLTAFVYLAYERQNLLRKCALFHILTSLNVMKALHFTITHAVSMKSSVIIITLIIVTHQIVLQNDLYELYIYVNFQICTKPCNYYRQPQAWRYDTHCLHLYHNLFHKIMLADFT